MLLDELLIKKTLVTELDIEISLYQRRLLFLEKAEDTYPVGAPGPCFQFLVESELLNYFCCFVRNILVNLCTFLCVSVSLLGLCPWITFF